MALGMSEDVKRCRKVPNVFHEWCNARGKLVTSVVRHELALPAMSKSIFCLSLIALALFLPAATSLGTGSEPGSPPRSLAQIGPELLSSSSSLLL